MSAAAESTRKPSRSWKHSDIGALVAAFTASGVAGVCKAFPAFSRGELEEKLQSLGVLKLSEKESLAIANFGDVARKSAHPAVFARAAIRELREIVSAQEAATV